MTNVDLNCLGPLIYRFFSINTTVLHNPPLVSSKDVEPQIWRNHELQIWRNHIKGKLTVNYIHTLYKLKEGYKQIWKSRRKHFKKYVFGFKSQLYKNFWASLLAQTVKTLLAKWESQVQSLVLEDPLQNDYPLQYSCWRITQTEEPGGLSSTGSQRSGHN